MRCRGEGGGGEMRVLNRRYGHSMELLCFEELPPALEHRWSRCADKARVYSPPNGADCCRPLGLRLVVFRARSKSNCILL